MNRFIFTLFVLCSFSLLKAQNDTVYFDSSWEVTDKEHAAFYRLPLATTGDGYLLLDFFISGAKQFEGVTTDPESEIYQGVATWFYENGKTEQVANYENGVRQGEFINYDKQGRLIAKGIYKDDSPDEGSFAQMSDYFVQITNYENGKLVNAESYDPTGTSKAKVILVVTNIELQNGEITYYNQKGERIGTIKIVENQPSEGVVVEYSYNPMSVLSIWKVSEGLYKSPANYYYSNGSLKRQYYFETDYSYPTKEIYFDDHGKVIDSLLYIEGIANTGVKIDFATSTESSATDLIEKTTTYRGGELNGKYKTFYPNGKLRYETTYKDGYETGDRITYDTLGKKLYNLSYHDGSPWTGTSIEESTTITYKDGIRTEEKQFYDNGQLKLVLTADGTEITYDTKGNEIGSVKYVDGQPFEGKKVTVYYDQIDGVENYEDGVRKSYITYSEGIPTYTAEYNEDGNYTGETYYYTSGAVQKKVEYFDGSENLTYYYAQDESLLGELSINEEGEYNGDYYEFYEDQIQKHIQYENGEEIRTSIYDGGQLISDIQKNGESFSYDVPNDKKYTCIYNDGLPYEGTKMVYSPEYDGITEISNYKDGQLDGEYILYSYVSSEDYSSGSMMPEYVYNYSNGKREGEAKQYYQGILIKTTTYSDDMLNGECKIYDLEGNEQSTIFYKDDYPYEGILYEYDYYYQQLLSVTQYHDGLLNGEQKYYVNGELSRIEFYENAELKNETSYLQEKEYTLNYKDSSPFNGTRFDTYNNAFYEYKDGAAVSIKTYTDNELTTLESLEVFKGEYSVRTTYFSNGNKKDEISKADYYKTGAAQFYDYNGKIIASGVFESDIPSTGSFAFYSNDYEENYLIMTINKGEFQVTEYIDGVAGRKNQYNTGSNSADSDEIQKFIVTIQHMFDTYQIGESTDW